MGVGDQGKLGVSAQKFNLPTSVRSMPALKLFKKIAGEERIETSEAYGRGSLPRNRRRHACYRSGGVYNVVQKGEEEEEVEEEEEEEEEEDIDEEDE